jgi:hypothetical protein
MIRVATLALLASCGTGPDEPVDAADCPPAQDESCLTTFAASETTGEQELAEAETERIAAIQDRHADELWAIDGVVGFGVSFDCTLDTWVISVTYDAAEGCPAGIPADLEGVPVVVVAGSPAVPV